MIWGIFDRYSFKTFNPAKFRSKKFGKRKFVILNFLAPKYFQVKEQFGSKKYGIQQIWGPKNLWSKNLASKLILSQTKYLVWKNFVPKEKYFQKKCLSLNLNDTDGLTNQSSKFG